MEYKTLFVEEIPGMEKKTAIQKETEQNIRVLSRDRSNYDFSDIIKKIFLPEGFPNTVSEDYISYQIWDTAQAFCSTISGILATQEVLRGVGVGDAAATPLAATISWVMKDGFGHIAKIVFACVHGKHMDAYCKTWRLYADVLNDCALCFEMALPFFGGYGVVALCFSSVAKAVVGVAGGATRIALTQHHALTGNLGDVSAKDAAQETAVNLTASLIAVLILSSNLPLLPIFMLMVGLHLTFNLWAVREVTLKTLNAPRFLLIIERYLQGGGTLRPRPANNIEQVVFDRLWPCTLDRTTCGYSIVLGESIADVVEGKPVDALKSIAILYRSHPYQIVPIADERRMLVVLKRGATVDDILCAYYHAVLLAYVYSGVTQYTPITQGFSPSLGKHFDNLLATIDYWKNTKPAVDQNIRLARCVNALMLHEWPRLRSSLTNLGWDLSKQSLVVGPWRLADGPVSPTTPTDTDKLGNSRFLSGGTARNENPIKTLNAYIKSKK